MGTDTATEPTGQLWVCDRFLTDYSWCLAVTIFPACDVNDATMSSNAAKQHLGKLLVCIQKQCDGASIYCTVYLYLLNWFRDSVNSDTTGSSHHLHFPSKLSVTVETITVISAYLSRLPLILVHRFCDVKTLVQKCCAVKGTLRIQVHVLQISVQPAVFN